MSATNPVIPTMSRRLVYEGARDTIPLIVAAVPFGIVYGALAQAAGLSLWQTLGMSLFVYAGASQFITVTMIGAGAALPVIVVTVFIVNLRHMLYAASLMPQAAQIPAWIRVPMGFWLTDETFAVVTSQKRSGSELVPYFMGSAVAMYVNWLICGWIGFAVGEQVPDMTSWGLDVAMVVAFIGIVVPALQRSAHWACAATAAVCILFTHNWPHQSGLLFSSLMAIGVGVMVLRRGDQAHG